jgi:trans-2,3-dihydro-3-hydroxyanthranilate isomerase
MGRWTWSGTCGWGSDLGSATVAETLEAEGFTSVDQVAYGRLDLEAFASLAREGFSPLGNDLCARFFFEAQGVREDPATGNGAAFHGAYLLQHRLVTDSGLSLRIEQGYEIRRP